ncbi:hypothetical protein HHL19_36505 [Streptomyces sp. R302]|nr:MULTISPECIES: hypothetical protein [unclassified Streptomyces]NML55644.1 hypothetical protein [Streptomyces sp. R301]NML84014.1 hypothetical protein [Streptomyces sp. R302]
MSVPRLGATYELAMCGGCVLAEEEQLERRAEARQATYRPGGIGPAARGR